MNVDAINGILAAVEAVFCDFVRRGIEIGRFGFEVAAVGRGGRASISDVSPGIRIATTF